MITKNKQFITLLAVLAILLVQFAAQVHATEHPFHQEEPLCISLQSAEQEKGFLHDVAYTLYDGGFLRDIPALLTGRVSSAALINYSPRAPPATAV